MDISYGHIKTQLSDCLTQACCGKLCSYFDILPADREKILKETPAGLALLYHLEEKDRIRSSDLTELHKGLEELKLKQASKILREWMFFERIDVSEEDESAESDDDSDGNNEVRKPDFQEFIKDLGLSKYLVKKLRLHDFLTIKDQHSMKYDISIIELFWQKLSSLDYRARSNNFLSAHSSPGTNHFSIKDFIFAVMHCSDKFLRQDIIEKMSACQLAVPVILKGIDRTSVKLLTWSLRRIVKKWRAQNSVALEEHVLKFPMYTVSIIRVGEIKGVSKSDILNTFLGPWQGNGQHSHFLSSKDDCRSLGLSHGCVEAVWYIPMKSNSEEKLKKETLFLNLRGDGALFTAQAKFVCQASNLTIALVSKQSSKNHKKILTQITTNANACILVNINEERKKPSKKKPNFEWKDHSTLKVRFLNEESRLCDELFSKIPMFRQKCTSMELRSVANMAELCGNDIEVEETDESIQEAKDFVKDICNPERTQNLTEFKKQSFPLQPLWKEWVKIDKQRLKPNTDNAKTVEELKEDILATKNETRKLQLRCGLSDTVKTFSQALKKMNRNSETLGYFVTLLQEELFQQSDNIVRDHLSNLAEMEKELSKLNANEQYKANSKTEKEIQQSNESQETKNRRRKKLISYRELCRKEYQQCKQKIIGWEHFVRELGQWYEAHSELDDEELDVDVVLLPGIAVGLLESGYSLEIMDGDTGHLPISWITSVLDQLANHLENPSILVLSIVGVQSSGKSTLLNSMFGVRFPVRAGRCTRGLFLRLITLEKRYAQEVGFQYIFLVDSEGIRSLERTEQEGCRFDNELVTLALCISDLTILNIEGENIGPDMTGLLQIAAHAMIRMKEVDLTSQCRIIQQRVSDVNARERNMENMERVIHILDEATIVAATEEGFAERYQQFSDVFDLRFDEDLQFIPCLWTGSMSPPNPFYGDIVTQLKENVFLDVNQNSVNSTLTVNTFTHRLRDVWRAVKSENFLFNFEDSVKAIDSNNMSMKLNEWIIEMRTDIKEKIAIWRRRLKEPKRIDDNVLELMQKECHDELQDHKTRIQELFETYISGHERANALRKYTNRINQTLKDTISDLEINVRYVLKEESKASQLHRDALSFLENVRKDLHEFIQSKRDSSQKDYTQDEMSANKDTENPAVQFSEIWKKHMHNIPVTKPQQQTETEMVKLEAVCEELLIYVSRETAVSSEIEYLMKVEGGILSHKGSPTWTEYFPHKGGEKYATEWLTQYQGTLQGIIDKPVEDMKKESAGKRFDPNHFQLLLQRTLQDLSSVFKASEPPYLLKGKALLHTCGRLFQVVSQSPNDRQDQNSMEAFIENEKQTLLKKFTTLLTEEIRTDKVNSYIKSLFTDWLKDLTIINMKKEIVRCVAIKNKLGDKTSLIRLILSDLFHKNNLDDYLAYIHKQKQYIKNWVNDTVVKICCSLTSEETILQQIVNDSLRFSVKVFYSLATYDVLKVKPFSAKVKRAYNYEWINNFVQELLKRGFTRDRELATFLREYHISDLDNFVKELKRYIENSLKDDIVKELEFPTLQNEKEIKKYILTKLFDDPSDEVLERVCLEQCPIL